MSIVLTPGHAPERPGASAGPLSECPWATEVCGIVFAGSFGLDVECWTRDEGRLSYLCGRIDNERPTSAIDVHFDACEDPTAHGCSVLVASTATASTRRKAAILVEEVCRATGVEIHGGGDGVMIRDDLAYTRIDPARIDCMVLEAGFPGSGWDKHLLTPAFVAAGILAALRRWVAL